MLWTICLFEELTEDIMKLDKALQTAISNNTAKSKQNLKTKGKASTNPTVDPSIIKSTFDRLTNLKYLIFIFKVNIY